ncbi:hypothetical protein PZH39_17290, partial [Desulfovibrio desulfuricans]|uniref:hypothetical protein n=1 Tax=Desulfovibrio desulfuricans TaxID=876 RepID=UPI0023B0892F
SACCHSFQNSHAASSKSPRNSNTPQKRGRRYQGRTTVPAGAAPSAGAALGGVSGGTGCWLSFIYGSARYLRRSKKAAQPPLA